MKRIILLIYLLIFSTISYSQTNSNGQNSTINNLVHTPGYKTSHLGDLPEYIKTGIGKKTLILIPGLGFDASVFEDFMDANKNNYTMYAITIPGFGKTMAPPMPPEGTSYGEQSWSKGVIEGLLKLMEKEKIKKATIAGHFTNGTQLALRMAIDHPDKVSEVIILGGQAKFIGIMKGEEKDTPLNVLIQVADKYSAAVWFKHMKREFWDDGNYLPEIYSLDSAKGAQLWRQVAEVPVPVMVRYLCEYIASELKAELVKINCPVLIMRAMFNDKVLEDPINNYVKPQYINTWNGTSEKNPLIKIVDVKDAASFVWKDKPAEVYKEIKSFLEKTN